MVVGVDQPPGSRSVDLQNVVISRGKHQDLASLAVVEHLSRAEGLQAGHVKNPGLLLPAAHRVDTSLATEAGRVPLVIQRPVHQGEDVVFYTAVCEQKGKGELAPGTMHN
jgi:hypothetical protein